MSDVYSKMYNKLRTFIFNEDLLQEIMIKIYLNLDKYDSTKGTLNSFISKLCKNVIIDNWRRNKKHKQTYTFSHLESLFKDINEYVDLNTSIADTIESYEPNPFDLMVISNEKLMLLKAIKSLSKNYREIFIKLLEGKKYTEIAQETGKKLNVIKALVFRGKQKIKDYLLKNK